MVVKSYLIRVIDLLICEMLDFNALRNTSHLPCIVLSALTRGTLLVFQAWQFYYRLSSLPGTITTKSVLDRVSSSLRVFAASGVSTYISLTPCAS